MDINISQALTGEGNNTVWPGACVLLTWGCLPNVTQHSPEKPWLLPSVDLTWSRVFLASHLKAAEMGSSPSGEPAKG